MQLVLRDSAINAYNCTLANRMTIPIVIVLQMQNQQGPTRFRRGLQSSAGHTEA